ncbi:hypothetical protein [Eisenbergiella massiliensis]|uniref:hypothetical protein n=1 Tax=Eisenbergiella massiliensis TaxID=1720294 RepID=UPI003FA45884
MPEDAKFCSACGAPVTISQEASPVPQRPAGRPDEVENIQVPKPEPLMQESNFNGQIGYGAAAPVQKKSKKGLIIGLSLGGVLLAVILAVALIFVFGLKGGSKGNDGSVPLGYSTVVYDDQYTYFLSETEAWAPCIKRVRNDLSGQPEILYETEKIEGDGWSLYSLGGIFLWNDKICFIEFTNATEQGDEEYEIHWLSKDGKENGTLISYEDFIGYARSLYRDDFQPLMEEVYFFGDYLIFSDRYSFCQLNLNTGGMFEYDTLLSIQGPACFVAYNDGYYYYFVPDTENNRMGETLYRMYSDIEKGVLGEAEEIGKVPLRDDEDVLDFWEKYYPFIPKGDYLYYADSENIYRLSINDGKTETLASYDDDVYNRFCLSENGFYYFEDMTLHFLNTETLEETIFDEVEGIPDLIYAGANDACWMQDDSTSHRYNCFFRVKQGGSMIYFGESDQDASAEDSVENQDTVNTTALYADVVENFIGRYGNLSFGGSDNEFYAQGVFKIDLKDFNQDGTDELMILYTAEENGIYPYIEIFTVEDGGLVKLFSQKTRDEFHEAAMSFCLYQNGGNLYVPVYDSLDQNPVYVHLYGFDENREFGEVYQYENNAFYMNQLPDGMEFTKCEETQFYTNTQFAYYDDFENVKEEMMESLQTDMEYMLNEMGIAAPENSSTQTNQSEFDITSMLGEWTLELILPDGSTVRRVIKLQADGTMTMRAEDGSWQDYTYVMDDTHFDYTYVGTGISSSGTYTISGDVITVYLEAEN